MRDLFDVVVFDLDDTLVPVLGPIRGAHEGLAADVQRLMPLSARAILTDFRGEMARYAIAPPRSRFFLMHCVLLTFTQSD